MSILSKLHTQVHVSCTYYSKQSTDSMQSLSKFQDGLQKNRIYNTKICIEPQITLHIQITLEKDQRWEHCAPWFQTISQSCSYQISMILSIVNTVIPEYSLEGLLLKLKLQCYGHLMQRADSLEKTLMLAKFEDKRRRGWQRMRWLDSITDSMDVSLSKQELWRTDESGMLQSMESDTTQWLNNNSNIKQT